MTRNFKFGVSATLLAALVGTAALADDAATVAAVERFYDVFNTQNVSLLPELVTDDYIIHGTSPSLPDGGMQEFAGLLQGFAAGVADLNYEIHATHVSGDFVRVRGTVTGTLEGPVFGIPATGQSIEFGAIDIHRVEDGRVAESWHIEDFAMMLRQIGALPGG